MDGFKDVLIVYAVVFGAIVFSFGILVGAIF